jgi:hypothetical protein
LFQPEHKAFRRIMAAFLIGASFSYGMAVYLAVSPPKHIQSAATHFTACRCKGSCMHRH